GWNFPIPCIRGSITHAPSWKRVRCHDRNSLVRAAPHTRDVPVVYGRAVSHSRLTERHGHEHVELAAGFVTAHGVERPLVSLAQRGDRITGFVLRHFRACLPRDRLGPSRDTPSCCLKLALRLRVPLSLHGDEAPDVMIQMPVAIQ